jgi:hypothetical protein
MADGVHLNDSPPSALLWKLGRTHPSQHQITVLIIRITRGFCEYGTDMINAANETGNTDESRSSSLMLRFIQRRSAIGASEF